jgi:hypothetical protein
MESIEIKRNNILLELSQKNSSNLGVSSIKRIEKG